MTTGLLVTTGNAAQAQFWVSNYFTCSGPYTTGGGTSHARGGGAGWPSLVEHWRINASGSDKFIFRWNNVSTLWAYRRSFNHGAGYQAFGVIADYIDSANSAPHCDFIG